MKYAANFSEAQGWRTGNSGDRCGEATDLPSSSFTAQWGKAARPAMFRTLLLLIAFVVVIVVALVYTGYINLNRNADGSVSIQTKDVQVGTTTANVQVPVVKTETRQVEVPSVAVTNRQGNSQ
jgi:hypothetical protein